MRWMLLLLCLLPLGAFAQIRVTTLEDKPLLRALFGEIRGHKFSAAELEELKSQSAKPERVVAFRDKTQENAVRMAEIQAKFSYKSAQIQRTAVVVAIYKEGGFSECGACGLNLRLAVLRQHADKSWQLEYLQDLGDFGRSGYLMGTFKLQTVGNEKFALEIAESVTVGCGTTETTFWYELGAAKARQILVLESHFDDGGFADSGCNWTRGVTARTDQLAQGYYPLEVRQRGVFCEGCNEPRRIPLEPTSIYTFDPKAGKYVKHKTVRGG